jgi:hypothetical protein
MSGAIPLLHIRTSTTLPLPFAICFKISSMNFFYNLSRGSCAISYVQTDRLKT